MKIDIVLDVKTVLGEGPLWDVDQERLYWIDSKDARIFRATADGRELRAWLVPAPIGSMALTKDGASAVTALATGLHVLDFATGETTFISDPEAGNPNNRLNDGKVDRRGRYVFGSMDTQEDERRGGSTGWTRTTPSRSWTTSSSAPTAPAGHQMIRPSISVTPGRVGSGPTTTTSKPGRSATAGISATTETSPVGGFDGSTVDAEGGVWNALVYDGKIVRFTPDGTVDRIIDMPVKKVTSVMFGGPALDTLYVTSMARPPLPRFPEDPVAAGSLFAITGLGVTGTPEPRFGGAAHP